MANEDLIRGGTASVTAGQVAVAGQGVSWANVREGDFFGAHVGLAVPIAAIAGDAITLAFPWTGPTQAAAAYAIQPKGDVTRFQDRVRLLVESLTNGTLAALTAAGSAADKIAYYSGTGVAALTDFKASARSLLGLTPAADKIPYFTNANTAALADLTAYARSNVINKADRAALLASGTGIGVSADFAALSRNVTTDLNSVTTNGRVIAAGSTLNIPVNGGGFVVDTMTWENGAIILQTAYEGFATTSVRRQWVRKFINGAWTGWLEQIQNSFTPVEQGGGVGQTTNKVRIGWTVPNKLNAQVDGLELGAIWCDQYSPKLFSGNGYQKFANGFTIQWGYVNPSTGSQAFNFPTVFGALYCVQITPAGGASDSTLIAQWISAQSNSGFTVSTRAALAGGSVSSGPFPGFWMAVGTS